MTEDIVRYDLYFFDWDNPLHIRLLEMLKKLDEAGRIPEVIELLEKSFN